VSGPAENVVQPAAPKLSASRPTTQPVAVPASRKAAPKRVAKAESSEAARSDDKLAANQAAAETAPESLARSTWRRLLRWGESWGGSAAFHVMILILLSLATLSVPKKNEVPNIVSVIDRSPEELNERLDESLTPATMLSTSPSIGSVQAGDPLDTGEEPQLSQEAAESLNGPQVNLADVELRSLPGDRLTDDLGMNAPGDPSAAVKGYGGALDRITQELLMMLTKGKVLVVWLLDESESMEDDREEIKKRIDRVYQEMGLRGTEEADALLTAIASYGPGFVVHTEKPTTDAVEIRRAIDAVPNDDSGKENMCQAVISATHEFRRFATRGKRQLALILVSDESGDDGDRIEEAIAAARSARARVYTLGREAVFGYPYAHFSWTWVDPKVPKDKVTAADKIVFWIRVRRGPETPLVEQLQTNGLWQRYDAHPSGFGPYEQVRLCRETGGIFFMLPSLEGNLVRGEKRIYELDHMRPYLPDLSDRETYIAERDRHPLRKGLWEIIGTLNPYADKRINLREYFDAKDGNTFVQQAGEEQLRARDLLAIYQEAEKRLSRLQRWREQETSPRWQANYDILYAQVVSYQMRLYEYAAYLDAFLKNPKSPKSSRTNRWRIVTVKRTITGEQNKPLVERSEQALKTVIELHPGTPYAARAQWELARGFGIDVVEYYRDPRRDTVKVPKY